MSVLFKNGLYEVEIDGKRLEKIAKRFIRDVLDLANEITEKLGLTYEAQRILVDELFMNIIGQTLTYVLELNRKATFEYYRQLRGLKS